MDRYIVISGCSGGGKSGLIDELLARGHSAIEEAGRRVVRAGMRESGSALPWIDMAAFARLAISLAINDHEAAARLPGPVFFDRSVVDVAAALERSTGEPALQELGMRYRYAPTVFMAPPWRELFHGDPERRHDFETAAAEYDRLCDAYAGLGYDLAIIPKCPISKRADWIERQITTNPPCRDWP